MKSRFIEIFILRIVLAVLLTLPHALTAQLVVRSGFLEDSVVIGDHTRYFLTATYPKKLQLLFPDSTYNYQPFEFIRKQYFTTQTHDTISYDSAIYTLSTFEVDLVQSLQLPVSVLHQQDCTTFLSIRDSVFLQELVKQPLSDTVKAENLPLISNTAYEPVDWLLNYPLLSYIGVGLLILSIAVWLIFGKKIRKHFMIKRLRKQHENFVNSFTEQIEVLRQRFTPLQTEQALSNWKYYMESLDEKPYARLTTKETAALLQNELLANYLRLVDTAIYGRNQQVEESLLHLREHATKTFQQKLEKVAHG